VRLVASLAPLTDTYAPVPARSAPHGGRPHAHGGGDGRGDGGGDGGGDPASTAPPNTAAVPRAVSAAEIGAEIAQMTQMTQIAQRERAVARITQMASVPPQALADVPGAAEPGAACTDTTCGIYAEMGWSEDAGWAAKHRASLQAEGRVQSGRVQAGRVQAGRVGAGRVRPSSAAARCTRAGAMLTSSSAPRLGPSVKTAPWLTMSASGSGVLNKVRRRRPHQPACPPRRPLALTIAGAVPPSRRAVKYPGAEGAVRHGPAPCLPDLVINQDNYLGKPAAF
jgi:hypothetical protein